MIVRVLLFITSILFPTAAVAGQLQVLREFDPALGELPESITIDDDNNVYASFAGSSSIARIAGDGSMTTFAALPLPADALSLGIKFGPDGCLYALSASFAPEPPAAFLWRVCAPHAVEQLNAFDAAGFPNDLAFGKDGTLFVTDPFLGRVWRIKDGQLSVWLEHPILQGNPADPALPAGPFGVDGIALAQGERALLLGNLDYGEILRVDIEVDGSAGDIGIVARSALLRGVDGLALDVRGNLYAAVNARDALLVVSRCGDVRQIAQGAPLDAPSSLVFGRKRDGRTLYVASFAINRAITGGVPKPALLALPVKNPGKRLP